MIQPATIAEERIARLIAFWHGQKIVAHTWDGAWTVAAQRGFSSGWSWEVDRYVEAHWREYVPAAQAVLRQRGDLIHAGL